jgi:hypothetical protein
LVAEGSAFVDLAPVLIRSRTSATGLLGQGSRAQSLLFAAGPPHRPSGWSKRGEGRLVDVEEAPDTASTGAPGA